MRVWWFRRWIEMAYMKNGDLADYLQRKPKKPLQLSWIQQMASTIRFTSLPCAQDTGGENPYIDTGISRTTKL
jgi:hypothetical protein